jgi:16S rRNA C1402 (ribose-2'-O) methylase RsmI
MDNNSGVEIVDCEDARLSNMKVEILGVMCNVLNYLSFSSYDYYYTQHHQECRKEMNAVYDKGATLITVESCKHFYECLKRLESVTDTDDPDYYEYRRKMRRFIISLSSSIKT